MLSGVCCAKKLLARGHYHHGEGVQVVLRIVVEEDGLALEARDDVEIGARALGIDRALVERAAVDCLPHILGLFPLFKCVSST